MLEVNVSRFGLATILTNLFYKTHVRVHVHQEFYQLRKNFSVTYDVLAGQAAVERPSR